MNQKEEYKKGYYQQKVEYIVENKENLGISQGNNSQDQTNQIELVRLKNNFKYKDKPKSKPKGLSLGGK